MFKSCLNYSFISLLLLCIVQDMRLQLKKFDMSSIAADKVVVMIGKRDTGKSFLCKDLLWHQRKIPVGTVISATEAANCFYGDMVPPIFIHNEYSEDIIQRILMRQEKLLHKRKQPGGFNINPSAFLILDDCLYDNSWTKSKHVRSLFMNGRHFKMFFIITMQYALGIPPNLRTNIDYVFILRENNIAISIFNTVNEVNVWYKSIICNNTVSSYHFSSRKIA